MDVNNNLQQIKSVVYLSLSLLLSACDPEKNQAQKDQKEAINDARAASPESYHEYLQCYALDNQDKHQCLHLLADKYIKPELGKIDFQKLTALVGLAPYSRDSGQYRGKRSIFAGRGGFRKVLYMAAVASLRCNPKLKAFYDRLIQNHKPPKVALVALMRKLLAFMHALFKHNSFWRTSM